jgi:hypothetical protein
MTIDYQKYSDPTDSYGVAVEEEDRRRRRRRRRRAAMMMQNLTRSRIRRIVRISIILGTFK